MKYNFKLLTNFSSQHFANTHQRLHLRQNVFSNQSLQYTPVLDWMKALIAKLYLAAKQFFSLGRESWCKLTKRRELKYMLRFHFAPPIDWTTVFSCIIQCCELRQFWKGSKEQSVVSRAFYLASHRNLGEIRGSNCLTESSLCSNYDSFIPLSFIHFGIPYNLKSTLRRTGEISCVIEILFFLM